jgi:hypothetical protein
MVVVDMTAPHGNSKLQTANYKLQMANYVDRTISAMASSAKWRRRWSLNRSPF